jgi:putative flippase GtrA
MTAPHEPAAPPVSEDPAATGPSLRLIRDQRVAFLAVGGVNTAVGFGWFVLFHTLFGSRQYMLTLLCAHVCAVLCAFALHRRLVFRVHGHLWLDLARFELVNLSSLAINAILLPVAVSVMHLQVIPAQLAVTAVTVVMTYAGHKMFSFRRPKAVV